MLRFRPRTLATLLFAAAAACARPGAAADAPAPGVYPGDGRAGGTADGRAQAWDAGWRPAAPAGAALQLPGTSLDEIVARLPPGPGAVRVRSSSWGGALELAGAGGGAVVLRGAPVAAVRLASELRCPGANGSEPVAALVRVTPGAGGLWIQSSFDAPAAGGCELSAEGRSRLLRLATDVWMWAHGLAAPRAPALP